MDATRLADCHEIMRLKAHYCQYLDMKRWADFATLFAPDAQLRTNHTGETFTTDGRDAIVERISTNLATVPTIHYATNPDIAFVDDDTATATWCAYYMNGPDGRTGLGWYEDTYVRRDGRWLFKIMGLRINFMR